MYLYDGRCIKICQESEFPDSSNMEAIQHKMLKFDLSEQVITLPSHQSLSKSEMVVFFFGVDLTRNDP